MNTHCPVFGTLIGTAAAIGTVATVSGWVALTAVCHLGTLLTAALMP